MSYYRENEWWASPYNDCEEVLSQYDFAEKVEIHDATLRDGEQTPGGVFDVDDKTRIAEMLNELGVERIEAGMPAVSPQDKKAVEAIAKRGLKSKIFTFARAIKADIDMASDLGASGVVIEVPIGFPKLKYQFNWTWEQVYEKSVDCINYAKEKGLFACYFPYDTTRSRSEDLEKLIKKLIQDARPDSIGLVDTMGCATPRAIEFLVKKMKRLTNGLPIEVHTHNDFGMAVATELAGIAAGASCVHSCFNGLGERTGNAPLEQLMVAMKILYGINEHYNIAKLPEFCTEVAKLSGVELAKNMPLSGERNYTRESGIGVNLVLEHPLAMFATNPQIFNRHGDIALGKKSGKASIEYFLKKMGEDATSEQSAAMLDMVKKIGAEEKRLLTEEEFAEIVKICKS